VSGGFLSSSSSFLDRDSFGEFPSPQTISLLQIDNAIHLSATILFSSFLFCLLFFREDEDEDEEEDEDYPVSSLSISSPIQ